MGLVFSPPENMTGEVSRACPGKQARKKVAMARFQNMLSGNLSSKLAMSNQIAETRNNVEVSQKAKWHNNRP